MEGKSLLWGAWLGGVGEEFAECLGGLAVGEFLGVCFGDSAVEDAEFVDISVEGCGVMSAADVEGFVGAE